MSNPQELVQKLWNYCSILPPSPEGSRRRAIAVARREVEGGPSFAKAMEGGVREAEGGNREESTARSRRRSPLPPSPRLWRAGYGRLMDERDLKDSKGAKLRGCEGNWLGGASSIVKGWGVWRANFSRACGTNLGLGRFPGDKSPGYYQLVPTEQATRA